MSRLNVNLLTNVFAVGEHGHDHLPWPLPADCWLWQSGDCWVAQVYMHYGQDWWEGADEATLAERPMYWARHILDVPETGTLIFNDKDGNEQTVQADTTAHIGEPPASLYLTGVTVAWFPGDDPDDPQGEQFENDPAGWVAFGRLSDDTLSFPMGATPRATREEALTDAERVTFDGSGVVMAPPPPATDLYPEFRAELTGALVNRNRGDIADRVAELDDDQIADCLRPATDHAEKLIDTNTEPES